MGTKRKAAGLANVLFGKTRGKVLRLLFGHPEERYYFQQIRRHIGAAGVGAVQRELETLVEVGILVRSSLGNQVFFQANRSHPIFAELRALLAKTVGVFQLIQLALEPLADEIQLAFVY